jgi:hypothetical protein
MAEIEKPVKKKNGRPTEWTDEKIEKLGNKLEEWAVKDDSYALIQFCRDERIGKRKIHYLSLKSENFMNALMYTKACIASRMIENLHSKSGKCHPVFFNKYIRYNDFELDEFLKDQEKQEKQEGLNYLIKTIDFSKTKKEND